jgi:hypothetical protein
MGKTVLKTPCGFLPSLWVCMPRSKTTQTNTINLNNKVILGFWDHTAIDLGWCWNVEYINIFYDHNFDHNKHNIHRLTKI